jgi:hypothetical protein
MLERFLDDYFDLIKKVNDFHWDYLTKNKFKFPKANYIELKKFIDTATNFLRDIDINILNGLAGKLYQDIESLYNFYNDFYKKSKYTEYVFYREYLESIEKYKKLGEKVKNLKKSMEEYNLTIQASEEQLKKISEKDPNYKKIKKTYVDSIYELSKVKDEYHNVKSEMIKIEKREEMRFFPKFNKLKEINLKKLEKIINTKLYYFEKILWFNASKSPLVIKFFNDSHIEGNFSTKTFIKYFLKNIDISKSSNSKWYLYLQKMLKVAE